MSMWTAAAVAYALTLATAMQITIVRKLYAACVAWFGYGRGGDCCEARPLYWSTSVSEHELQETEAIAANALDREERAWMDEWRDANAEHESFRAYFTAWLRERDVDVYLLEDVRCMRPCVHSGLDADVHRRGDERVKALLRRHVCYHDVTVRTGDRDDDRVLSGVNAYVIARLCDWARGNTRDSAAHSPVMPGHLHAYHRRYMPFDRRRGPAPMSVASYSAAAESPFGSQPVDAWFLPPPTGVR